MDNQRIARSFQAGGNLREFMERTRLTRPETRFEEPGMVEIAATVSPRTIVLLAALLAAAYAPAVAPAVVRAGERIGQRGAGEERS